MDSVSGASASANGSSKPPQAPSVTATPPAVATPSNGTSSAPPNLPIFSASTAELLARARASAAGTGTPGYEAAREQLMKNMMMSDKLPIPAAGTLPRRGRGGRKSRGADGRSPSESTPGSAATPSSERGRGKAGRGRGRGRGGRGSKRKRSESVDSEAWNDPTSESDADRDMKKDDDDDDDDNASDVSAAHTPLPKVTKSGRSVNKPLQYVPVIPEPTPQANKKKRPYRRNIDAAVCKMCHRPTSPTNNQIVFCDGCGTPYHQYCHDPPIENDVVEVQEKEWFCTECTKARASPQKGDEEGLVSGESLTIDEKRSRLSALPTSRLVEIVLRASSLQPSLALFPATAVPASGSKNVTTATEETGAHTAQPIADSIDVTADEPYDGYDTDPPAHYPKAGNGLARTLPPETEDLDWLVDENEDVFSHQVRPLSGIGLNGGDVSMSGT